MSIFDEIKFNKKTIKQMREWAIKKCVDINETLFFTRRDFNKQVDYLAIRMGDIDLEDVFFIVELEKELEVLQEMFDISDHEIIDYALEHNVE